MEAFWPRVYISVAQGLFQIVRNKFGPRPFPSCSKHFCRPSCLKMRENHLHPPSTKIPTCHSIFFYLPIFLYGVCMCLYFTDAVGRLWCLAQDILHKSKKPTPPTALNRSQPLKAAHQLLEKIQNDTTAKYSAKPPFRFARLNRQSIPTTQFGPNQPTNHISTRQS